MAAAERSARAVSLLRQIFSEFRKGDSNFSHKSAAARYVMALSREHQTTQKVLCKAPNEMEHLAATYGHYLRSTRRLEELQEQYKGGERSTEEAAHLVGLELPQSKL